MTRREIAADVLDSRRDDWTITDDGPNRGPVRTWSAPILPKNDATPIIAKNASKAFPQTSLTRSGLPDAYAFLRPKVDAKKLDWEDFPNKDFDPPSDVPAYADAMGYPQYRTVPEPLSSFEYDIPGVDRYQAGMLISFLRRTDAGALDAWGSYSGNECRALYRSLAIDDAGMPKSWYEVIDKYRDNFVSKLKAWSGGKFMQGDVDLVNKSFSELISHATDDEKWTRFNQTKALTFKLLNEVDSPIVSGGQMTGETTALNLGRTQIKIPKVTPIVRGPMSSAHAAHMAEFEKMWKDLEAHVNAQGGGVLSLVGKAATSVGGAIGDVGKGVYAVGKGIATPVAALVTSPVKLASDIASGKNVFESLKDTVKRDLSSAKDLAPYVQAAISIIPGVGTVVSGAISAGAALAQGKPITEAMVAGIKGALPGGPIASAAFDTVYAAARGQNLGDAALQALVNNAPGGEVGKRAAMTAVAVAKGQNLQQAALAAAKGAALSLIPGGTPNVVKDIATQVVEGKNVVNAVTSAATAAVGKEAMASFSPLARGVLDNTGPQLLTKAGSTVTSLLPTDARLVAQSLLKNPTLRSLPIEEVARRLGVSNFVAREGMAAVVQAAQRSGGQSVPSLSQAKELASRIPVGVSFDQAMSTFASRAAPKSYSHNAVAQERAARLRRAGGVYYALQARGLDCGALDPLKMPTIKEGSTGEAVIQWQKILGVTADGKFGPQTKAATVAFQKKNGLTADGIVGPKTWAAGVVVVVATTPPATVPGTNVPISLPPPTTTAPIIAKDMPTIREGSSGPPVKTWQIFLNIAADGIFGPQTKAATISFQTKNGLVADGIVGPKTWEKAMSGTSVPTQPPGTPPPPVIISTPPVSIPPMTIPPIIPGLPPITTPPVNIPPVVVSQPPGLPPVVSTPPSPPNPPGQPPPPPPITTSPPTMPPVVLPPPGNMPPTKTASTGLLIGGAVVLGALLLMGSGSRSKIV